MPENKSFIVRKGQTKAIEVCGAPIDARHQYWCTFYPQSGYDGWHKDWDEEGMKPRYE